MLLVFKVMVLLHGRDSFSFKYLASHELRVKGNDGKVLNFFFAGRWFARITSPNNNKDWVFSSSPQEQQAPRRYPSRSDCSMQLKLYTIT